MSRRSCVDEDPRKGEHLFNVIPPVATPFAEEYDAPWLYGLAAVTNLARVGSRNHWVSDTVAGSVLGYTIGKVFWEASRTPPKGAPRVLIRPSGVDLSWAFN